MWINNKLGFKTKVKLGVQDLSTINLSSFNLIFVHNVLHINTSLQKSTIECLKDKKEKNFLMF